MADTAPTPSSRDPHVPSSGVHNVDQSSFADVVFQALVLKEGLPVVHSDNWTTQASSIELEGERVFVQAMQWGRREIIRREGLLLDVGLYPGTANVSAAASSEDAARAGLTMLREVLPAPDPTGRQEVTVTFWTYGPHGPQPAWRTISVPSWEDIGANYASGTHDGLARLMEGFRPAHGGQLVLSHGEAGTGKTFALRALAWEWRSWCDVHYIVDPDSFFGQHADYLMHVLLQSEWESHFTAYGVGAAQAQPVSGAGDADGGDPKPNSWRLLVLEDTGELLQPDAKAIIGQGLSRFLNVADGLIGQGLRVLVLVTTNEEIKKLHPAVARPGRSAANVRFDALSADEATGWLAGRGITEATPAATIAELYARVEGLDAPKQSTSFGGE